MRILVNREHAASRWEWTMAVLSSLRCADPSLGGRRSHGLQLCERGLLIADAAKLQEAATGPQRCGGPGQGDHLRRVCLQDTHIFLGVASQRC